jgi:hypothetical protein
LLKFDAERIISEKLKQDNNHLHKKIVILQQEISILQENKEKKPTATAKDIDPQPRCEWICNRHGFTGNLTNITYGCPNRIILIQKIKIVLSISYRGQFLLFLLGLATVKYYAALNLVNSFQI